jgi:hypothetical protein
MCCLAGRYDNPIPARFLAPIDCLKIPALYYCISTGQALSLLFLVGGSVSVIINYDKFWIKGK